LKKIILLILVLFWFSFLSCEPGADLSNSTENEEEEQAETDPSSESEDFSIIGTSWETIESGFTQIYFFNPLKRGYLQISNSSGSYYQINKLNYSYNENDGSVSVSFDDASIPSLTFTLNEEHTALSIAYQEYTRITDQGDDFSIANRCWTYMDPENSRISYYVFYMDNSGEKVLALSGGYATTQSFTYDYTSTDITGNLTLKYGVSSESFSINEFYNEMTIGGLVYNRE